MIAPASWSNVDPYRACAVCQHGRTSTGGPARATRRTATHCVCLGVTGGREPVPVSAARAAYGPCGPEATFQDFPGLHDLPERLRHDARAH